MTFRKGLQNIVDFILNQATPAELDVIQGALERRKGPDNPTNLRSMDFQSMAKKITGEMSSRFGIPGGDQIHKMTRNLVKNMILEKEPNISEHDLDALLDQWVPRPGQQGAHGGGGMEAEVPLEALVTMVEQFLTFSTGKMPPREDQELRKNMPEWPKRYWEIFSATTRTMISEFLKGGMSLETFWKQYREYLSQSRS